MAAFFFFLFPCLVSSSWCLLCLPSTDVDDRFTTLDMVFEFADDVAAEADTGSDLVLLASARSLASLLVLLGSSLGDRRPCVEDAAIDSS